MHSFIPTAARRTRRGAVNKTALGVGAGVAAVVLGLLVVFHHSPVPAPTGYTHYASADHVFTCDAPNGWRQAEATAHNSDSGAVDSADTPGGVLFGQGSATIDITTGRTAELLKNALLTSSGPVPDALTGSRAPTLHRQDKAKLKMMLRNVITEPFHEYDGAFGDSVAQEWRASGNAFGLGGRQHGYLVSMVGGDHTATVTCQCAESDWPTLKPAFLHVINSLAGTGAPAPDPASPYPGIPAPPASDPSMPPPSQ